MPTKSGICGLCRQVRDLQDSHLLPSSLYKFMKEPSLKNPNPVILEPGVAVPSSREVRQYFLCAECEDLFNNKGEKWIVRNCAQPKGSFPLYTNVVHQPPHLTLGDVELYSTDGSPAIQPEQIE